MSEIIAGVEVPDTAAAAETVWTAIALRRLLRGRARPRAACSPGPAIAGRAAEAHRRRAVRPLTETTDAFARHGRTTGRTIIQVAREQGGERP
jgi:hypothetical protein